MTLGQAYETYKQGKTVTIKIISDNHRVITVRKEVK